MPQTGMKAPQIILFAVLSALMVSLHVPPVEAGQEIVSLETRPGVTVKVLIMGPDRASKGTLLMFPGGNGANHFSESGGKIRLGGNFLVRSSNLFLERSFAVAIVDVPSDQAYGMSDPFRSSKEHTEDVRKIIDLLVQKLQQPIFLVGTSRGTISAAHLGISLKDQRIGAIVLTSSIGASKGGGLSLLNLPLENIAHPVLFVHHRDDGCWASRFNDALQARERIKSSPRTHFIEVSGGDAPRSQPCEALSYHGYLGKEREVVAAITDWIQGKPVVEKIGP